MRATLHWAGIILMAIMTTSSHAQTAPLPVPLVDSVDLPRFMGDWYVIAHIPPDADRTAHNGVESYRLENGRIETTYRRRLGSFDAPIETDTPTGYVEEGTGNALWGMRFYWWFPFKLEFRISHLEPDYSVTIIGRSKRDYVWLMSRTPQMSDADYAKYVALMKSWGYDPAQLVRMPQRWP